MTRGINGNLLQTAARYIEQGRVAEAEHILNRILATRPDEPKSLYLMAVIRLMERRQADAESFLRRSLAADPNQPKAALNLGVIVRGLGRLDEAAGWFEKAVASRPDYGEAHFNLGLVHQELGRARRAQGDLPGALAHLERAEIQAPGLPNLAYNKADVLQHLGRREEAIAAFRQAVTEDPLDLHAHRALNQLIFSLARDEEFLRSYDEAFSRTADPRLHIAKASALLIAGRVEEAVQGFESVIMRSPEDVDARYGLASAHARRMEFPSAIGEFRKAMARRPQDPHIRHGLISALLQAGDPVTAAGMAEELVVAPAGLWLPHQPYPPRGLDQLVLLRRGPVGDRGCDRSAGVAQVRRAAVRAGPEGSHSQDPPAQAGEAGTVSFVSVARDPTVPRRTGPHDHCFRCCAGLASQEVKRAYVHHLLPPRHRARVGSVGIPTWFADWMACRHDSSLRTRVASPCKNCGWLTSLDAIR
jgi:tetratricopeptide (TPR) repeat protein